MDIDALQKLIKLADQHDFVIASDECYSEIYFDEQNPPPGLLQAAAAMGRKDFSRCVVFHSLSKRSNVPGLRSGFVAGDENIMQQFLLYRTYHGCAMPESTQYSSISLWKDEDHVKANRDLYRDKFDRVQEQLAGTLTFTAPQAAFYLWPETPMDDETFARELYAQQNVTVLPGSYLSRDAHGANPGANYVRIALVAPLDECIEAANRIVEFVKTN
jgi:N-succinyldiaminopimelate aminotransferase